MSWKKKFKQLMNENPEALHPALKALHEQETSGHAWDRADWHLEEHELHAHRPIMIMLSWLAKKGLLSSYGQECFRKYRKHPQNAAITDLMVVPIAHDFLNKHYEEWYRADGINWAIDIALKDEDSSITKRWAQFKTRQS
ncbi:hypothetical protein [Pleionea sp. CnH1-48]|uniref:hypothetical protein n=1 Tax=Pleionea sp. CnH1-48 TaxID=2954494 RepID=UPI002096E474|nr:hypothetical protein [Pleionea sp. CnH1-48]MCO7225349.1 hypothetical protein [Pleionea sp. CnH1-48]